MLASEYAAYEQQAKDEAARKKAKKAKGEGSDSSEDPDDSEPPPFGRTTAKRASALTGRKKKVLDALFHVKWWRIVLGMIRACTNK